MANIAAPFSDRKNGSESELPDTGDTSEDGEIDAESVLDDLDFLDKNIEEDLKKRLNK